jgi:hypothetical protein
MPSIVRATIGNIAAADIAADGGRGIGGEVPPVSVSSSALSPPEVVPLRMTAPASVRVPLTIAVLLLDASTVAP